MLLISQIHFQNHFKEFPTCILNSLRTLLILPTLLCVSYRNSPPYPPPFPSISILVCLFLFFFFPPFRFSFSPLLIFSLLSSFPCCFPSFPSPFPIPPFSSSHPSLFPIPSCIKAYKPITYINNQRY